MNTLYYTNNVRTTAARYRYRMTLTVQRLLDDTTGKVKGRLRSPIQIGYAAALDPLVLEAGRNRLRWILVQIMVQIRTPPRLRAPHASWK
jgi:hypothetical protein